jgi:hypothetical protein
MTVTWSDLVEETPEHPGPSDAVTTDDVVTGVWHVLPGSGTEELAGLRGRGTFTARRRDGRFRSVDTFTHWYEREDLPSR